jgi:hypothetical protein
MNIKIRFLMQSGKEAWQVVIDAMDLCENTCTYVLLVGRAVNNEFSKCAIGILDLVSRSALELYAEGGCNLDRLQYGMYVYKRHSDSSQDLQLEPTQYCLKPRKVGRSGRGYDAGADDQISLELMRKIVRRYSLRGQLVLSLPGDMGRGSDVVGSLEEGRHVVSIISDEQSFWTSGQRVANFAEYQRRVRVKTSDLLSKATKESAKARALAARERLAGVQDRDGIQQSEMDLAERVLASSSILFDGCEDTLDESEGAEEGAEDGDEEMPGPDAYDEATGMILPQALAEEDVDSVLQDFMFVTSSWRKRCMKAGHSATNLDVLQQDFLKRPLYEVPMRTIVAMQKDRATETKAKGMISDLGSKFVVEYDHLSNVGSVIDAPQLLLSPPAPLLLPAPLPSPLTLHAPSAVTGDTAPSPMAATTPVSERGTPSLNTGRHTFAKSQHHIWSCFHIYLICTVEMQDSVELPRHDRGNSLRHGFRPPMVGIMNFKNCCLVCCRQNNMVYHVTLHAGHWISGSTESCSFIVSWLNAR